MTTTKMISGTNPILKMDFPDPDVIFVDGVYYLISTTMHFLPGGQILRSYDLIHWEHAAYVFDHLDSTDAQRLVDDKYIYGKGVNRMDIDASAGDVTIRKNDRVAVKGAV